MPFRAVYVYIEALNQGFLTSLSQDDRVEELYKQVEEVILKGLPYELITVELTNTIKFNNWILPQFLRLKNLAFDDPLYVKAIIQKKDEKSVLLPWRARMKDKVHIASKKRPKKEQSVIVKSQTSNKIDNPPSLKAQVPVPTENVQSPSSLKQKRKKRKQSPQKNTAESSDDKEKEHGKEF
eukprot:g8241.t1